MLGRKFIKKFKYVISIQAVEIIGLVLVVAAQAYPLGAFEGHIVSVTAVIDPPHPPLLASGLESGPTMNLLTTAGEKTSADNTAAYAGDELAVAPPDKEVKDDSGASDAAVSPEPSSAPDETANTDATDKNQITGESVNQSTDNLAPPETTDQPEILTTKIEVISEASQLIIENSGAFAHAVSEPAADNDKQDLSADGAAR